jgi:hypothetical protein
MYCDVMSPFFIMSNKSFKHIIIIQIVLHNLKTHSNNIDKQYEFDLKFYTLTFKVRNTL